MILKNFSVQLFEDIHCSLLYSLSVLTAVLWIRCQWAYKRLGIGSLRARTDRFDRFISTRAWFMFRPHLPSMVGLGGCGWPGGASQPPACDVSGSWRVRSISIPLPAQGVCMESSDGRLACSVWDRKCSCSSGKSLKDPSAASSGFQTR